MLYSERNANWLSVSIRKKMKNLVAKDLGDAIKFTVHRRHLPASREYNLGSLLLLCPKQGKALFRVQPETNRNTITK